MRLLALLALAAVLAVCRPPAGHAGHTVAYWRYWTHQWQHREHVARKEAREANRLVRAQQRALRSATRPIRRDVFYAIRLASSAYGVPYSEMMSVARCESGFDPSNVNPSSGASGVMQFLPSTFANTPFAAFSIFDPLANVLAAAWLVRHDGSWREWQCAP